MPLLPQIYFIPHIWQGKVLTSNSLTAPFQLHPLSINVQWTTNDFTSLRINISGWTWRSAIKLLFIVSNAVFKQVPPFKTTCKPFTTLQATQKITFDLYSSHRDRADLVAPELSGILQKNCLKLAWTLTLWLCPCLMTLSGHFVVNIW